MKHDVCVVTGTRAEYSLLRRLLFRLKQNENIALTLLVTGSHLSDMFGNTQTEITEDGFQEYVKIPIPIEDDSKAGMAYSAGMALVEFAAYFRQNRPELLVVLGDRYEIFSVSAAAYLTGIPIAHISGGDITEGAVDNVMRHCITQMSVLHFPGCEQSAKRIIQMGGRPDRVFNVGEPGVENCLNMELLPREELAEKVSFEGIMEQYAVVTFHPVTMEEDTAEKQIHELIAAIDSVKDMSYIITMSNADAGGRAINEIWLREGDRRNNWFVVSSLGVLKYLSALKYSQVVIGNSSSGIVEAPSIGVPTVNIGNRQKGRMMAESIVCCEPRKEEIVQAINRARSEIFQKKAKQVVSPFGDGKTSERVEKIIIEYLDGDEKEKKDELF